MATLIKNHYINKLMVASVSFVSTGTFNHVFPSLPMHTLPQLWTVSDYTIPYTFEQSLCQLLFPNLEHFNCGRKFRLCACLKRMNTEMCFCACVYMKSVRTTIIRQSNSIQNRQHTTLDSLGHHVFTN